MGKKARASQWRQVAFDTEVGSCVGVGARAGDPKYLSRLSSGVGKHGTMAMRRQVAFDTEVREHCRAGGYRGVGTLGGSGYGTNGRSPPPPW